MPDGCFGPATIAGCLLALVVGALPLSAVDPERDTDHGMTAFQLVLLYRGDGWRPADEDEIQALQEARLEWLAGLFRSGTLLIEGPLSRSQEIRGVMVLDVPTTDEARRILDQDPYVRAGRLRAEVHPWWSSPGRLRAPEDPRDQAWCYLGLFLRPDNLQDLPEERLQEIQRGHLANLADMTESGDMILAGPMGDDGKLRGIMIFRTTDVERLERLVRRDPAIENGRLGIELYGWRVPRGSLPVR